MQYFTKALIGVGLLSGAGAAYSQNDFISANVALSSDYLYRGVSQTGGGPALQGGFDYSHDGGFYIGTWASSIAFDDGIEVDYYSGFSGSLTEQVGYELGLIYYDYPGMASDDFLEFYAAFSYGAVTASINYSDDFYAGVGKAWYYAVDYVYPLVGDMALGLHYGWQSYEQNVWGSHDRYHEYSLSLAKPYAGMDWSLAFSDTNLSDNNCGDSSDCASRAMLAVTKSF